MLVRLAQGLAASVKRLRRQAMVLAKINHRLGAGGLLSNQLPPLFSLEVTSAHYPCSIVGIDGDNMETYEALERAEVRRRLHLS